MALDERFWSKVDKTDNCWNWTAARTAPGYGAFWLIAEKKSCLAHRAAYQDQVGPIPDGMMVDHICCNRACVNPEHLRLATCKQNQENRVGARVDSGSGVRGVYRKGRAWYAYVQHDRVNRHIGAFATLAEAEAAVIAKRCELFSHNTRDRAVA